MIDCRTYKILRNSHITFVLLGSIIGVASSILLFIPNLYILAITCQSIADNDLALPVIFLTFVGVVWPVYSFVASEYITLENESD